MKLITYLAKDNQIILENLIDRLLDIADVTVTAHEATPEEAIGWPAMHGEERYLAIVALFLKGSPGLSALTGRPQRESDQQVVVLSKAANDEIRKRAQSLGADVVFDQSSELDVLFAYCREKIASITTAEPEVTQASMNRSHGAHQRPVEGDPAS
jgi:DNA-binding NarL/FixJ family response regulator